MLSTGGSRPLRVSPTRILDLLSYLSGDIVATIMFEMVHMYECSVEFRLFLWQFWKYWILKIKKLPHDIFKKMWRYSMDFILLALYTPVSNPNFWPTGPAITMDPSEERRQYSPHRPEPYPTELSAYQPCNNLFPVNLVKRTARRGFTRNSRGKPEVSQPI